MTEFGRNGAEQLAWRSSQGCWLEVPKALGHEQTSGLHEVLLWLGIGQLIDTGEG